MPAKIIAAIVFIILTAQASLAAEPGRPCNCSGELLALQDNTQSTTLQSGTQSTTLNTGTQSTTLQTGTQSTTLHTGTESALIQGGTKSALIQGQVNEETGPINVLFLVDCSYSMKEGLGLGGSQKMEAAKQVLENALVRIPTDINLGLRVFGQSFSNDPYIDCQQSALLVPIGQGNRRAIIERVRQVHPFGLTPLTYALMQAERDFHGMPGTKTIILISDGAETCGGNPCEYIKRLAQMGIKMKIDIVGMGLKHEFSARNQLNCIASASGGKYYDANTAAELVDSISQSVSKAISGRIISHPSKPLENAVTPPNVSPTTPGAPTIKNSSSYSSDSGSLGAQSSGNRTTIIAPPDTSILEKLLGK
jgi:Ca-activated chloride channel family protein